MLWGHKLGIALVVGLLLGMGLLVGLGLLLPIGLFLGPLLGKLGLGLRQWEHGRGIGAQGEVLLGSDALYGYGLGVGGVGIREDR